MTNKSLAQLCAIAAIVSVPTLSWAGTPAKDKKAAAPSAPEKLSESVISGDIGVNVVTAYYYHGSLQQNHSPSFQPYLNLNFKAYEGDGVLNKAVFTLGLWNSLTNPGTGPVTGPGAWKAPHSWVESDIAPSLALTFGKITITESYLFMTFPNGSMAQTSESLISKLSFDDSDALGSFALHPSITHQHETSGKSALLGNNKTGNYWEAAVAPSVSTGPVTLTVPLTLGYGSSGYYIKDGYGYFSAGLNVGYALPMPKNMGTWTATTGVTYYNLNKSAVGGNMDNDFVGSIGLGVAF